jgi:hypothetical protein
MNNTILNASLINLSGIIQKILDENKKTQENETNDFCTSNVYNLTENSNQNGSKNRNIEVNKLNTNVKRDGSNRAINTSPNKSIINKTHYSSTPINAITKNSYQNYIGNGFEKSQWSANQDEKNSKSNEQSDNEEKIKIKYRNPKRKINNKSLTGLDYRKRMFNMTAKKSEATKSIISKKMKSDMSIKKVKNKIKYDKVRDNSKKNKSSNKEFSDKIINPEESKIKEENNKGSFINTKKKVDKLKINDHIINNTNTNINNTKTNTNTNSNTNTNINSNSNTNTNTDTNNNINTKTNISTNNNNTTKTNISTNNNTKSNTRSNTNNNIKSNININANSNNNNGRNNVHRKSFQNLNSNTKERYMPNISRVSNKKLTHYNTKPNIGLNKKLTLNAEEIVKKLSKKEQSYFLLSKSPVLRLTERLFFGRSTPGLRNVQTVTDIVKKNEKLLKNKKKELEEKIGECDKRINKAFSASKTAEINFNFILTKDEDELKSYIWFTESEKEKNEYYCYIKLIYLLVNEKYENIELKNLTEKLYNLISKKGHKTIKEYLYLIYFKKKENINIVYNIDNINHLLEESSVDINYNIKFCRFALFTSFLFKEIIQYGNEVKNTVELKLKTKEFIDVINKKLDLYKNINYMKKK